MSCRIRANPERPSPITVHHPDISKASRLRASTELSRTPSAAGPRDRLFDNLYTRLDDFLREALPSSPLRSLLRALVRRERVHRCAASPVALLPLLTCALVGGSPAAALPAALAWNLLQLAAQILDRLEDGSSLHELTPSLQPPEALNAATTLLFLALRALDLSSHPAEESLRRVRRRLHDDALSACLGQHRDLTAAASSHTLDDYWEIIGAKSGLPFAWAAEAGALLGGAPEPQVAACHDFGYNLGLLVQLADDWADLWAPDGQSDLARGHRTLPALYALVVAPPSEGKRLTRWLAEAPRCRTAEAKARQAIIRLGAPHYLLVEAERCRRRALGALSACPASPWRDELAALLNLVGP